MGKSKDQHKEKDNDGCSKPFQLNCLLDENSESLSDNLRTYIECRVTTAAFGNKKQKDKNSTSTVDFTPWWDSLIKSVVNQKTSTSLTKRDTDPDHYDNWFSKTSSEGSNWLAGPQRMPKPAPADRTKVEDIAVPSIYETKLTTKGRRALKRERKAEREKTLGKKWFEMRAPDKDDPARVDMELIRMRDVFDPKRFYKNQDRKATPKYFQIGTVVDEGTEYYGSRLTKKQRKQTLVEELMADASIRQYNKKKYGELQQKMRGKKKMKGKKV